MRRWRPSFLSGPAASPPISQPVIDGSDLRAPEQPSDPDLLAAATTPDLNGDPAVGERSAPEPALNLDARENPAVPALRGAKRPGVQDRRYAPRFLGIGRAVPHYFAATNDNRALPHRPDGGVRLFSGDHAMSCSSPVITPCPASYAAMIWSSARSRRSWSAFRRSASSTQALTVSASPAATAA